MDIKKLKAFAMVAEFGSFSRAAAVLGVVQPMLSRQVRALEEELGVQLVHRNGRGIVLTEAGSLLNEYAKGILATLARAESEVGALRGQPARQRGDRHAAVDGIRADRAADPALPQRAPSINMRVIEGYSGYLLEWLLTGKIDVAVLYNAPRTKSLLSEPLLDEELFLIGAANDPSALPPGPIKAKRLAELPLILPSRPHGLRLLIDQVLMRCRHLRQRRAGGRCAASHHQARGKARRLHHSTPIRWRTT
jgi:LysR family nitrogen assimilation transcriptional regulator